MKIKVVAYDSKNQISQDSVIVNVNNTQQDSPPNLNIISPDNNSYISGITQLVLNVVDDKGISKVEVYLNNQPQTTLLNTPYTWNFNTTEYTDGLYEIKVIAYDTIGQVDIKTLSVNILNSTSQQENNDNYDYTIRNYPNPFKFGEKTEIKFKTKDKISELEVCIFNLSGKLVNTLQVIDKGNNRYYTCWDGKDINGEYVQYGIYICRVKFGTEMKMRKIIFLK